MTFLMDSMNRNNWKILEQLRSSCTGYTLIKMTWTGIQLDHCPLYLNYCQIRSNGTYEDYFRHISKMPLWTLSSNYRHKIYWPCSDLEWTSQQHLSRHEYLTIYHFSSHLQVLAANLAFAFFPDRKQTYLSVKAKLISDTEHLCGRYTFKMPVTYVSNGMERILGQMASKWTGLLDINTPAALKLYFKVFFGAFFLKHKNRRVLRYWVLLSAIDGTSICSLFPVFAIIFSSSEVPVSLEGWKLTGRDFWISFGWGLLGAGPARSGCLGSYPSSFMYLRRWMCFQLKSGSVGTKTAL